MITRVLLTSWNVNLLLPVWEYRPYYGRPARTGLCFGLGQNCGIWIYDILWSTYVHALAPKNPEVGVLCKMRTRMCVPGDSTRMRRRKPSSCAVGVKVTHQYRSPLSLSELFWTWCFHGVFIMCRTEIFCTLSPFLSPALEFRVASRRLYDRSALKSIELKIDLAWSSEWFW